MATSAAVRPASREPSSATTGTRRDREQRREEPQADETAAEVRDDPREQEVERRAAALGLNGLEQAAQRLAADEERERLVLVRRPGGQTREQEHGDGRRAPADAEPERP